MEKLHNILLLLLLFLCFAGAGLPDTGFVPNNWKPLKQAAPGFLTASLEGFPGHSDFVAFSNSENTDRLFVFSVWDRLGTVRETLLRKLATQPFTSEKTTYYTSFQQDGATWLLSLAPNGSSRTICAILSGNDSEKLASVMREYKPPKSGNKPIAVFISLVAFILIMTFVYRKRKSTYEFAE